MTDLLNNTKHASPSWLVNLTGVLAMLTPILPNLIQSLPGNVSDLTKDWISWILSVMTAVSGAVTMFSKSKITINGNQPKGN
jgi:hypothetical protein